MKNWNEIKGLEHENKIEIKSKRNKSCLKDVK